jgi:transposase
VCRENTNLFTIVVKSAQTQSGVPVAFLLTRSPRTTIVANWLIALRNELRQVFQKDYHPNVVIMDMGVVEYSAVSLVFPNARIFYCAFHVLQAWNRHMSDVNLGITGADEVTKKRTRKQVRILDRMFDTLSRPCLLQTSIDSS